MREQWQAQQRDTAALFASLRLELINRSFRSPEEWVTLDQLLPGKRARSSSTPRLTRKRRAEIADSFRRTMKLYQ